MTALIESRQQHNNHADYYRHFDEPLGEFNGFFVAVVRARNSEQDAQRLLTNFRRESRYLTLLTDLRAAGTVWPVSDQTVAEMVRVSSYRLDEAGNNARAESDIRTEAVEALANWNREHPEEFLAALRRIGAFGLPPTSCSRR